MITNEDRDNSIMRHNTMIQLYRITKYDVEAENPHKKGLKKILRDIFPVVEERSSVIPVKTVPFEKITEIHFVPVEVNGRRYLKTSETEVSNAAGGQISYRSLYILEDDFDEICHSDY